MLPRLALDARNSLLLPETSRIHNTLAIFPALYLNQISPGLAKLVHLVETVSSFIKHMI